MSDAGKKSISSIIITPTYNENANIKALISGIRREAKLFNPDILVVDSASPDRTADAVIEIQRTDPKVFLIRQPSKLGLGSAYQEGMMWALRCGYDRIITMDADLSHDPKYLDSMFKASEMKQLVVGSRYVRGGQLKNWPLRRKLLSAFANWYARTVTGLPFSDLTSGYQCFHSHVLKEVLRDPLKADGYAFLIALKFLAFAQEASYVEIPIVFNDRTRGESKISKRVIWESIFFVWKCFFQRYRIKNSQ